MHRWSLYITFLLTASLILGLTNRQLGSTGFGTLSVSALIFDKAGLSLSLLAIIANLPQLALSTLYFLYNSVFTSMLLSREWSLFAVKRQGLRVSRPIGLQRRAHTLSIPFRFAIPLIIVVAVSHWIQSQALFLARIDAYDSEGRMSQTIQCLGYSPLAWITMLALQVAMMLLMFGIGFLKYPAGIPIVRGCSLAISAACHPPRGVTNMTVRELRYGILDGEGEGKEEKAGLSSGKVGPLKSEERYGQGVVAKWFWGTPQGTQLKEPRGGRTFAEL